jgi:iron(III) transport system permease protein
MQEAIGERSFRTGIFAWVFIGVTAYWLLPWLALEYGLFDSTGEEYYQALGWRSHRLSLLVPGLLLVFLPLCSNRLSRRSQGKATGGLSGLLFLLIVYEFIRTDSSMGLGAGVVLLVLATIFSYGMARLGFLQGDTFSSGTVTLIIFVIAIFVFFPVLTIFYQVLIDREGTFAPLQFFQVITSFGIGRVVMNTLVLAISVGAVTTLLGLVFALYSMRSTSPLRHLMRVFYILPIITPPFVVGMSLILLFGRAGAVNDLLIYLFGNGGLFVP